MYSSSVSGLFVVVMLAGVAMSLAVASYARGKGYSFGLALIACFVVSPLIVWLIVALMSSRDSRY